MTTPATEQASNFQVLGIEEMIHFHGNSHASEQMGAGLSCLGRVNLERTGWLG